MSAMDLFIGLNWKAVNGDIHRHFATFSKMAMQHSPFLLCNFRYFYYATNSLDCSSSFGEVKRKIFESGTLENNTFCEFLPKGNDKVDVLLASRWAVLNKEQCKERCPTKLCTNCLGAYWGKCNSPKQVEPFPIDNLTKRGGV